MTPGMSLPIGVSNATVYEPISMVRLQVVFGAGGHIDDCAAASWMLCMRLGVPVVAEFNGYQLELFPGQGAKAMVDDYWRRMNAPPIPPQRTLDTDPETLVPIGDGTTTVGALRSLVVDLAHAARAEFDEFQTGQKFADGPPLALDGADAIEICEEFVMRARMLAGVTE